MPTEVRASCRLVLSANTLARAARHDRAHRRERIVGDLTSPHQIPQGAENGRVVVGKTSALDGRKQLGPERCAAFAKVTAQNIVRLSVGAVALVIIGTSCRHEQSG